MLAALLLISLQKTSVRVGPFLFTRKNESTVTVRNSIIHFEFEANGGNNPCLPVYSKQADTLVVASAGAFGAFDSTGGVLWSVETAYPYNPVRLVAGSTIVVATDGPMSTGTPSAYRTYTEWKKVMDHAERTKAYNLRTGRLVWDKPWTLVGTPLTALRGDELLSLSFDPEASYRGVYRRFQLLRINGSTGAVIGGWAVPERLEGLSLSEFFRTPSTVWKPVGTGQAFDLHEREGDFEFSDVPKRSGVRGRVTVGADGSLRIRIERHGRASMWSSPHRKWVT